MKYLTALVLLITACHYTAKAQNWNADGKFKLSVKIAGRDTGKLQLWYQNKNKKYIKDTAWIKDGKCVFTGFMGDPQEARLIGTVKSTELDDANATNIFIEPANMRLSLVEKDFKHAVLTGSRSQAEMDTLQNINAGPQNRSLDSLVAAYYKYADLKAKGDTSAAIKQIIANIWVGRLRYSEEKKHIVYQFVSDHPNSYISPYLLTFYLARKELPADSAKQFYDAFSPQIKYSRYGSRFLEQIKAASAFKPSIGKPAPGFILTDINNKPLSLAVTKGKSYLLIDFWASWCPPCRSLSPVLKGWYEKYHARGLDIISLSEDEDRSAWKKAITQDQTNSWHHALTNKATATTEVQHKYGVIEIPALYLIDKNGVLIGIYDHADAYKIEQELSERLK